MANSYELLLKIGGQLENSFGKSINGATKSLSGIGKAASRAKNVLVGALGAAGVGLSLKTLIDSGGEAEKATAQMNAVLKSTHGIAGMTTKQLENLADAQQGVTEYSENTTEQAENLMLTFTKIGKSVFPDSISAAEDMATALHTDVNSSVMLVGKALGNLSINSKGVVQGLTALKKSGVNFTDEENKQIATMLKHNNVAGAQKLVIKELETEFGGSAKAAGQTVSGQMSIIKNTIHSTLEKVGLMILPTVRALLPQVTGMLKQAAANLAAHQEDIKRGLAQFAAGATTIFTKVIPAISAAISRIVPIISGAVKSTLPILKDAFNFVISHKSLVIGAIVGIGSAMATFKTAAAVGGAFSKIGKAVKNAKRIQVGVDGVKKSLTGLKLGGKVFENLFHFPPQLLLIAAAIAAIAALAFLIVKNWGPISKFFQDIWNSIKNTFSGVGSWFKNTFEGAQKAVTGAWNGITGWFSNLWNKIKAGAVNGLNGIKSGISSAMTGVKSVLSAAWNAITKVVMAIIQPFVRGILDFWRAIQPGISQIMNGLKNIFGGAWIAIKNIVLAPVLVICDILSGNFGKIPGDMAKIWNNVRNGASQAWNGLRQFFSGILSAIVGIFTTAWNHITTNVTIIWNAIKAFLTTTWNNIVNTAKSIWDAIPAFFSNLWNGVLNIANTIGSALSSFFTSLWNGIKNTAINVWNGLMSFFSSLPGKFVGFMSGIGNAIIHGFDGAVNFIKNLPAQMLQWGKDMIDGLINGIKGAIGGIGKAAGNVANTIRSFLHFSVPDTGPLKDAASYGPDFMKLYSSGITKNIPALKKAAHAAAGGVNAGIGKTPISTTALSTVGGGNASGGQPIALNIKYAPRIIIQGDASKGDVTQAFDEGQRKFDEYMRKWCSEIKRRTGKDPIFG